MKKKTLVISLVLSGCLLQPAQARKHAFSIADHYRIVKLSDPQISPDGEQVAYVTTHTNLASHQRWSHIWMMKLDGTLHRQLTHEKASNSSPRFCPKGCMLAFLSNRGGSKESQLFLLPLGGGEARKLTDFPGGLSNPIWSPDCKSIAATARVHPECGADADCNRKILRAKNQGPLKAYLTDKLLYRHWETWRDALYQHVLLVSIRDGSMVDLTPGRYDAPGFPGSRVAEYAFSPDSSKLVFSSNHDPNPAETTNSDLWMVKIQDGGQIDPPEKITDNPGWDGSPAYSPDGRYIAYRTQKVPVYESDRFRLALYNTKTRRHRVITESFDNWITEFQWIPGAKGIVFKAQEKGRTPLFILQLGAGDITRVVQHAAIDKFDLLPDSKGMVFTSRAIAKPTELYLARLKGGKTKQLTFTNNELLDEVDFRPAEEFWVKSLGGRKVHTFLVKPHGFDPTKKYPLIFMVHGGPQGMFGDRYWADFQVFPGLGYVVAFANPTGSTGYGQAFTRGVSKDWGGKVYEDLMKVVDALQELPFVDADRMGAMGWSFGGYMMMWMQGHTTRFKATAAMMGVYDLDSMYGATEELWFPEYDLGGPPWEKIQDYRKWSPSTYVKNFKTPCLVITGEQDFRVPYTQSLQFFTALQRMRVPSRLALLTEAGHVPDWYDMAFYYLLHADWFHGYLGGAKPPWEVKAFLHNQVFAKEP